MTTPADDPDVLALVRRRGRRAGVALLIGVVLLLAAATSLFLWLRGQHELAANGVRLSGTVTSVDRYHGNDSLTVRYRYRDRDWISTATAASGVRHAVGSSVALFVDRGSPAHARLVESEDETAPGFWLGAAALVLGVLPTGLGGVAVVQYRALRSVVRTCGPWSEGSLRSASRRTAVITPPDGPAVTVGYGAWDSAWERGAVQLATAPDHRGLVRRARTDGSGWLRKVRFPG